ncbi:MAG: SpoIIE family protein phosphatase [Gammaproteobacteria bacterium]
MNLRLSLRWKLLALFLITSLGPAALLIWLDFNTLTGLANGLAAMNRDSYIATGRTELDKFAAAEAARFARDRTILELALRRQAREVEYRLAGAPVGPTPVILAQAYDDPARLPANTVHSEKYFRFGANGAREPLPVSFANSAFRLASGVRRADVDADIARLGSMDEFHREVYSRYGEWLHWQYTSLENGLHMTYPGHGGYPADFDPRDRDWYRAARSEHALVWTRPIVDVATRQISMSVAMPVTRPGGRFAGVTAIDVPVTQLLRESALPPKWVGSGRAYIVQPTTSGRLWVIAKQSYGETGGDWKTMLRGEPLVSADTAALAAMVVDMQAGRSGIRELPYRGDRAFWAYQRIAGNSTYLLFLVPYAGIVQAADSARDYTLAQFAEHARSTVPVVLAIVLGAALVAWMSARSVTIPLQRITRTAQAIASGDLQARALIRTGDELESLGQAFDDMVPKLNDRVRLLESLALAREVQQHLLPHTPPRIDGLDLAGASRYCDETGGDYYDFIDLGRLHPGWLGIAVGDVSGHGVPSALLMATVRALLRSHAERGAAPGELMQSINQFACRDLDAGRYMTLLYALVDTRSRRLSWVSAGHAPALVYRRGEDGFAALGGPDIPVGVDDGWRYHERHAEYWQAGDIAVLATDGIWETRSPAGEMFGIGRLKETVRTHRDLSAQALCGRILEEIDRFRGEGRRTDDVTLVVVRATA